VAQAKGVLDRAKGKVRDERNKSVKLIRGFKSTVSEDDLHRLCFQMDDLAASINKELEAQLKKKTAELEQLK
jgi:ribosome recycling factor